MVTLLCCIATAADAKHRKPKHDEWKREALVHDFGDVATLYYGPK
jgi:hypothetical protein